MPTVLQFRRGTTSQNNSFTGAAGELTIDTDTDSIRVHDGSTAGGSAIATEAYVDTAVGSLSADSISNGTSSLAVVTSSGNIRANVGGSQIALVTSSGVDVTGTITATTFSGSGASLTNLNGANISSGTIPDARIQASGVTQHEASLTITESQISDLGSYITASSTDTLTNKSIDSSQLTGTIADARLPASITSDITGTAALATSVTISANNTNNETVYLTFVDGATGTQGLETDTGLSYNPSTNILSTTATSARYADLAEMYSSDAEYAPGTVLVLGGSAEVTSCNKYADSKAAGVVSTNPAHLMNTGIESEYAVELALTGRVPCQVVGTISKGDLLTTSEIEGTATRLMPNNFVPGCIIGKALEDYNSEKAGIIEVLVGKV